jgi:hypothetical protein
MPDEPREPQRDRSTEAAERERRRFEESTERFDRERADERELELVREEMRRHDRDLKQNGSE